MISKELNPYALETFWENGAQKPVRPYHEKIDMLADKIRSNICLDLGYPSLKEMSKMMGLSSRTLRRRLQDEGLSYSILLNEAKSRDATYLLKSSTLQIHEVSSRLCYANPANFNRAFQKWTGLTPLKYRQSHAIHQDNSLNEEVTI